LKLQQRRPCRVSRRETLTFGFRLGGLSGMNLPEDQQRRTQVISSRVLVAASYGTSTYLAGGRL
jgi:hypothetical protein